jgi:aminoglycoside 3-N-acetyltransferase
MTEVNAIQNTANNPVTASLLKADFKQLGIKPGMVLLLHSSLSSLGWVCGGPVAVILALEEVLGEEGTLVMPTHSGGLSEPSQWQHPPVPESWWPIIRQEMPAYESDLTPTRGMGAIAETFRKQRGVIRSAHPQVSFAARGKYATLITQNHELTYALGEGSPLASIYDLDGWVLLLGVGHKNNTSLHLAEYRTEFSTRTIERYGAPIFFNGQRIWQILEDIHSDDSDFETIGNSFEESQPTGLSISKVGNSTARLFPQRSIVDYAKNWITINRK